MQPATIQTRHLLARRRKPQRIRESRDPDVVAQKILVDLEAALEQFPEIANDLGGEQVAVQKSACGNGK